MSKPVVHDAIFVYYGSCRTSTRPFRDITPKFIGKKTVMSLKIWKASMELISTTSELLSRELRDGDVVLIGKHTVHFRAEANEQVPFAWSKSTTGL
jgi:hypothetical protein